jgi:hypothetical protein
MELLDLLIVAPFAVGWLLTHLGVNFTDKDFIDEITK